LKELLLNTCEEPCVFVIGNDGEPLMPTTPAHAKKMRKKGRTRVYCLDPYTIQLIDRCVEDSVLQPMRLSIDPGSETTGICVARIEIPEVSVAEITDVKDKPSVECITVTVTENAHVKNEVVHITEVPSVGVDVGIIGRKNKPVLHVRMLIELTHRGHDIHRRMKKRAMFRSARRGRKTRYRKPRFNNRGGDRTGWLAPSVRHYIDSTSKVVERIRRIAPITEIVVESARFDTQLMQAHSDDQTLEGTQYSQGTLVGFEVGEYLLANLETY
jgi:hypothetical protein